jgi:hypothetical protein
MESRACDQRILHLSIHNNELRVYLRELWNLEQADDLLKLI